MKNKILNIITGIKCLFLFIPYTTWERKWEIAYGIAAWLGILELLWIIFK